MSHLNESLDLRVLACKQYYQKHDTIFLWYQDRSGIVWCRRCGYKRKQMDAYEDGDWDGLNGGATDPQFFERIELSKRMFAYQEESAYVNIR